MAQPADTGIVNIHGKQYQTVAYRVGKFREIHGLDYSLVTEIVVRDDSCVVMKASIFNTDGRLMATGHSEEYRETSTINKTSALENSETSAIGRALAAFGLGGTEFASADEVARALTEKKGVHKPTDGALENLTAKQQSRIMDTAVYVKDAIKEGKVGDALACIEGANPVFTPDEKVALWAQLDSKERGALKRQGEAERAAA